MVSSIASVVFKLINTDQTKFDETILELLLEWVIGNGGKGAGEPIGIRRAILLAINATNHGQIHLQEILEKNVSQFGDPLWIRHAPVIHQEIGAQCLLLSAAYVHQKPPSYLNLISRSSQYLNAISNRLASTNNRVRFLGMVVGEAISLVVDKPDKQMKFSGLEEMEGEEAVWWKSLVLIQDKLGDISTLSQLDSEKVATTAFKTRKKDSAKKPLVKKAALASSPVKLTLKEPRIQEVESSDDGLVPYQKADSDPEDSDDDPTLINRKKDSPPVYIRDLLYMLHSQDSFDHQQLALRHAASLIRRKANFGTEVSSHLIQLLETLVGLQDKFDMDDFDTMRLKAVLALVVAEPVAAGKWMAQRVFDHDWSLNQRCVILSAIGLAALEMSGENVQDSSGLTLFKLNDSEVHESSFPSKKLPRRLHDLYSYSSTPVDALAGRLEDSMIQPMAATAADKLSGPDILKVRKFSTRMDVEARRKKPVENKLGKVIVDAFFAPLTSCWLVYLDDYGKSTPHLNAHLLSLYIKTLTLLLHSCGPNTLFLPQLTSSLWDLLLSIRHNSLSSTSTVIDAVLLGLLTILEVNSSDSAQRRLAEECPKEMMETQDWVMDVFEGRNAGAAAEGADAKRRALAAGVLVRTREVVEKYERLLLGEMIG